MNCNERKNRESNKQEFSPGPMTTESAEVLITEQKAGFDTSDQVTKILTVAAAIIGIAVALYRL